jgi:hypothetical protein
LRSDDQKQPAVSTAGKSVKNKPSPGGATELRNVGIFCRPSGAFHFSTANPQLKLRAVFFRACGAVFFP